ncbi:3-dehydroquinate synthase, partial [Chloroflexota bacterium]
MHKQLSIEIKKIKTWPIIIGIGIINDIQNLFNFEPYSSIILMTDVITEKLYGKHMRNALAATRKKVLTFIIPGGENSKTLPEATRGYRFLLDNAIDRKALLCIMGGGVVGDLCGYIAATYLRGIDYIQVPTTFLAQVDSSIGGKVGVNFGDKKNMVGGFYQPRAIISDITLLQSLPAEEWQNGMAEVIKYGLSMDKDLFHTLASRTASEFSPNELINIVELCARLKTEIVIEDETEISGVRAILNFGHTIGHAIEALTNLHGPSHHGRAVVVGMMGAAKISERMGIFNNNDILKIEAVFNAFDLSAHCHGIDPEDLIKAIRFDKK